MSLVSRVLLALAVTTIIHPAPIWAQPVERPAYASVLDRTGIPVTALTATDFIVRENGTDREVLQASASTEPLRIAVLVDTSQAIERHVSNLREALRSFFREMEGNNEFALVGFGMRPTVLTDYTRDVARLNEGVGRLFAQPGSGAHLLDAIIEAARGLRPREGARSAIVVITAEGPEFSDRYHQTVLDELRAGTTLHSFVLARRDASFIDRATREREITLAKGARMTGGRREHLLTSMALAGRLQDLAAELQNQYRLVYSRPVVLIQPDTIDVRVKRPGLTVRASRVPLR